MKNNFYTFWTYLVGFGVLSLLDEWSLLSHRGSVNDIPETAWGTGAVASFCLFQIGIFLPGNVAGSSLGTIDLETTGFLGGGVVTATGVGALQVGLAVISAVFFSLVSLWIVFVHLAALLEQRYSWFLWLYTVSHRS